MGVLAAIPGREVRVLGLIGTGHMMSHFYNIALPPLFPLLQSDFGLSYLELGLIVTVFSAAAAVAQMPVGILVDRVGARMILVGGLLVEALALGAMAFARDYEVLLALAVLAGLGHSVFHPANYAIMTASIGEKRIGRAFSLHTLTGSAGEMIAPALLLFLAGLWSWKIALLIAAGIGVAAALAMMMHMHVLRGEVVLRAAQKSGESAQGQASAAGNRQLLLSPAILTLFGFFLVTTMTLSGIRTFSVVALDAVHNTPHAVAGAALTAFLVASAVGVLLGGILCDRTQRHNLIAAVAFLVTAIALAMVGAVDLGLVALVAVYALIGLLKGIVNPARDVMVNAIIPKGTAGSVFAFMSTGRLLGGTLTPVLLGWLIDGGGAGWIFWALAGLSTLALVTLWIPQRTQS